MPDSGKIFLPLCWLLAVLIVGAGILFFLREKKDEPSSMAISGPIEANSSDTREAEHKDSSRTGVLPDEEAKYLQDVEHFGGFVLGDLAFPKFAKALKKADRDALLDLFHPEFEGSLFSDSGAVEKRYSFATFRTWHEDEHPVQNLDREGFVDKLLTYREAYEEVSFAKLKVIKMHPVEAGSMDGPWEGTCKLLLAGKTVEGGVQKRVLKFRIGISGITDQTPEEKGWFRSAEVWTAEFGRSDGFLMAEITADSGLPISRFCDNWNAVEGAEIPYLTGGVYSCDYNQDGHLDLLITDVCDGLSFHIGQGGGKFIEVSAVVGITGDAKIAAFADLDNDGYEDLLLDNRVFKNEAGIRFRELMPGEHRIPLDPTHAGYAVADFDLDGKLDIYGVGAFLDSGQKASRWIGENQVSQNQLLRNLGNWVFEDVTEKAGVRGNGSSAFGAVWFDANGDRLPDIMTACYGTNDYYLNQGDGTFRPGELPGGYGGFSMGISVGDIDNDGLGDPFFGNMYSKAGERIVDNLRSDIFSSEIDALMRDFVSGNDLYRNRGDGTWERIGVSAGINDVGWAYGVGYGDLNGDGLLDTYSPVGFQSVSPNKPDG